MSFGIGIPIRHGWGLLLPAIPLCVLGLLSIQASVGSESTDILAKETLKQLAFMFAGLGMMAGALLFGYHRLGRLSYACFGLCLLMLLWLVLDRWVNLPFVAAQRNARRWVRFGPVQLQPSELAKIGYVLALAWYLRYRKNYRTMQGLIPPFLLTLLPMALILLQPDLGTVLLFLPVLFAMLYAAGAKARHLLTIIVLAVLCVPFFWMKIHSYQRLRVTGVALQSEWVREYFKSRPNAWEFFRPNDIDSPHWNRALHVWDADSGFQLVRSKIAIGSGGMFGHGWNQGPFVEHNLLPEEHNDFIFALIGHQWGFIGSLLLIFCYTAMVLIGFDIAMSTNDPFGRLVAVGLTTLLAVQTLTNLCMTVGLGPVTGVTLPFVSAGGSSMIVSFASIGLLISVAHHRPVLIANPPFEFEEDRRVEFVPR